MRISLGIPILAAWGWWCAAVGAEDAPKITLEGKQEVLCLDGLADPKRWAPAECTVEASRDLKAEDRATLHVHIPVDHLGGEKKYPIGWPRIYLNLQEAEKRWAEFERFEFLVHAKMSRKTPPKDVLNLQIHCPKRPRVLNRNLAEIQLGRWVRVSIPTRRIPHVADVARLGLNIAESNYAHGDKLDFYFGAFRLVRSAELCVTSMDVRSKVMFEGQAGLKVEADVGGPPEKVGKGLPLTLRQGKRVLGRWTLPVKAGLQTLEIDISKLKLPPGTYTLAAFDDDAQRRKTGAFRVVESPWEQRR